MPGLVPGIPIMMHRAQSNEITGTSPVMTTAKSVSNFRKRFLHLERVRSSQ